MRACIRARGAFSRERLSSRARTLSQLARESMLRFDTSVHRRTRGMMDTPTRDISVINNAALSRCRSRRRWEPLFTRAVAGE